MIEVRLNKEISAMLDTLNKKTEVREGHYSTCITKGGLQIVLQVANGGEVAISPSRCTIKQIHEQLRVILNVIRN